MFCERLSFFFNFLCQPAIVNFLSDKDKKQFIVIVSGSLTEEFMREICIPMRIIRVLVFRADKNKHYYKQISKLIWAVENDFKIIIQHILSFLRVHLYDGEIYTQAYHFNNEEDYINFLFFMILIRHAQKKGNFIKDEDKQKGIKDLYQFSVKYIQMNFTNLEQTVEKKNLEKLKNDLEKDKLEGKKIIVWYTEESFVYRMINNTIRTQNLNDIFQIRLLICLLYNQLINLREQRKRPLYRGTCLQSQEFELWKSKKRPVFLKGFTSMSSDKLTAIKFINNVFNGISDEEQKKQCKVLIKIDSSPKNFPIGIHQESQQPEEMEFLTNPTTFLTIQEIKKEEEFYIIETKISSHEEIISYMPIQIQKLILNALIGFEKIKFNLKQLLERLNFGFESQNLEKLLKVIVCDDTTSSNIQDKTYYDQVAGIIFEELFDRVKKNNSPIPFFLMKCGLYTQIDPFKNKELILEFFLKLLNQSYSHLAIKYKSIGLFCQTIGDYQGALKYCQQCLKIGLKTLGKYHYLNSLNFYLLANIYQDAGDFIKCQQYCEISIKISKNITF